jgi:hypothetical protein
VRSKLGQIKAAILNFDIARRREVETSTAVHYARRLDFIAKDRIGKSPTVGFQNGRFLDRHKV